METKFLRPSAVAEILGITDRMVRNWCAAGMIAHIRVPRGNGIHYLIDKKELARFIEIHREEVRSHNKNIGKVSFGRRNRSCNSAVEKDQ